MIAGKCNGGGGCKRCNVKGLRFHPTDEELMDYHLKPKILDPDSDQHYIGDIQDLSEFEPSQLFRTMQKYPDDIEVYFFWSPRYKNDRIVRKGKNGFWSETRASVPIDGEEELGGKKRVFVFCEGVYPGTRTLWFIHQSPVKKRKAHEKSAKPRRSGRKDDDSSRKKAKVSSAQEAQLGNEDLPWDANNETMSNEALHGNQSLPSKDFSENISNNTHAGDHPLGLFQSYGFPSDDIQQSHDLPSNSIINIPTSVVMQPSHHFPSNTTLEDISNNEDYSLYKTQQSNEGSQLSCHMPFALENDIISELLQFICDDDANYHPEFNVEELLAQLEQPQPTTTPEVSSYNELPPSSDLNRGADNSQDQRDNSEEEDHANLFDSLTTIEDIS